MDQLHGIIYPVTYPGSNVRARLAQVFDRITALVPVEDVIPDLTAKGPSGLDMAFAAAGIRVQIKNRTKSCGSRKRHRSFCFQKAADDTLKGKPFLFLKDEHDLKTVS